MLLHRLLILTIRRSDILWQGILVHSFITDNQNKSLGSQKIFLEKLQSKDVDINNTPDNNMKALHCAVYSKKFNEVKLLLEHGEEPNSLAQYREISLNLALNNGSIKVVEIFI